MSKNPADVAELVRCLVEQIVDEPDSVSVESIDRAEGEIEVQITVAEGDIGKVIGRQGRIIKSIRTLARAAASQCGLHAEVELAD